MSITINIPHGLRHWTNKRATVSVKGSTVGECLSDLIEQFPDFESKLFENNGKLHDYIDIYLNFTSTYPEDLIKPVKEGDTLSITLMIAGG